MTRRAAPALFALLLAVPGGRPQTPQVFRSGVDGLIIPVSVRAGNRPVAGLRAADFVLRDNGVVQTIKEASSGSIPIDLTLLLDLSGSVSGPALQRLKTAVVDTAGLLRPDDRIRLVSVSQVLREVFGFRAGGGPLPLDSLQAEGATSLYDAVAASMMRPSDPGRRQLIVAFTDGRDSSSIIDEATARALARLTDAVVNIVVPVAAAIEPTRRPAQPRSSIAAVPQGDNVVVGNQPKNDGGTQVAGILSDLVGPTSGRVIPLPANESISRAFRALLEDFRASYVLQYVPEGVPAEGWHEISVTTKSGRYQVQARRGYRGRGTIGRLQEVHP